MTGRDAGPRDTTAPPIGRGAGRFAVALVVLWALIGTGAFLLLDPLLRLSPLPGAARLAIHAAVIATTLLVSRAIVRRYFRARRPDAQGRD